MILGIALSVEAMTSAFVNLYLHSFGSAGSLGDWLHRFQRNMGITLGKVKQYWALQMIRSIQMLIDLNAIITDGSVDGMFGRRQIGNSTSNTKTKNPDFPRAVSPCARRSDDISDIDRELFNVQRRPQQPSLSQPLVVIWKIDSRLLPPVKIGRENKITVGRVGIGNGADVIVDIEDFRNEHKRRSRGLRGKRQIRRYNSSISGRNFDPLAQCFSPLIDRQSGQHALR